MISYELVFLHVEDAQSNKECNLTQMWDDGYLNIDAIGSCVLEPTHIRKIIMFEFFKLKRDTFQMIMHYEPES